MKHHRFCVLKFHKMLRMDLRRVKGSDVEQIYLRTSHIMKYSEIELFLM